MLRLRGGSGHARQPPRCRRIDWGVLKYDARDSWIHSNLQRCLATRVGSIGPANRYPDKVGVDRVNALNAIFVQGLSPGCQAVRCCQVICRAVGQLSGTVRCLCQTSCQVLSVLSGAVGCVSDRRGDL